MENLPTPPAEASAVTLTEIESRQLLSHEHVIQSGLETFIEVGEALMAIRDAKLYRITHKTFEDYCGDRWSIQRAHAHRLIEAAAVVHNLSPIGDTPKSESVARPLTKLPPAEQHDAWAEAQAIAQTTGKPVTGKIVREVVEGKRPKPAVVDVPSEVLESTPTGATPPAPVRRPVVVDMPGVNLGALFDSSEAIQKAVRGIAEAGGVADMQRKFRSGTSSEKAARLWWWQSAKPEKRAEFLSYIVWQREPILVKDRAEFIKTITDALEQCVKEEAR